jgi:hypothetical protein
MVENLDFKIKAAIDAGETATTLGAIKASLKDLRDLAAQVGPENVTQFNKITTAAGSVNDRIKDVRESVQALSGTPVERLGNNFSRLRSSIFELDLDKFRQSLGGIKDSFIALGGQALTPFKSLGTAMTGLITGTTTLTGAMKALGGAIAATGIGALVIAVALLVTYWNDLAGAGGLVGNIFKAVSDVIGSAVNQVKDFLVQIGLIGEKAPKTNKEITDARIAELEKYNKRKLDLAKAEGKSDIELLELEKSLLKEKSIALDNAIKNEKGTNLELIEARAEADNQIKILDLNLSKARKEQGQKDKEQRQKDKEESIKLTEEEARKKEEILQKAEAQRRLISELNLRQIQDANTKELETLDEKYEQEKFQYRNNAVALIELEKVYQIEREKILESQRLKAKEITDKELQDKIDALKAATEAEKEAQDKIQSYKDFESEMMRQYNVERIDLDNMYSQIVAENASLTTEQVIAEIQKRLKAKADANEIEKQGDIDKANKIIETSRYAAGAIDSINQLISQQNEERVKRGEITEEQAAKSAFNRNKAFGIVNAAINTAAGVTNVLATTIDPTGVTQALRIAFTIATGAAQIAKIASQKFEPKSGGSSANAGGGGGPTLPAGATQPQPTVQTGQFSNFSDFKPGELQEQRVYVVESDITGVQRKVRVIEDRSRY